VFWQPPAIFPSRNQNGSGYTWRSVRVAGLFSRSFETFTRSSWRMFQALQLVASPKKRVDLKIRSCAQRAGKASVCLTRHHRISNTKRQGLNLWDRFEQFEAGLLERRFVC
jgi:hypothetical protein